MKQSWTKKIESSGSFRVLKYNHKFMVWMGIHSYRVGEPTNDSCKTFQTYYIACFMYLFVIANAIVIWNKWPDIIGLSHPLLTAIGAIQVNGMFLCIRFELQTIKVLQIKLQEIIDQGITN